MPPAIFALVIFLIRSCEVCPSLWTAMLSMLLLSA
jgi:hypothetical protein